MIAAHENPFRTSRLLTLPVHWGGTTPEILLARWAAAGRRGALVGPHGTGKTTRLRALANRLGEQGWEPIWIQWHGDGRTLPDDWRGALRKAGPRTLVCLDGSENLGAFAVVRVLRRCRAAGGVLATLHRPSIFLPVLARHAPDAEVFVGHATRLAPESEVSARAAFAAAGRNAHEAFRRLYLEGTA